MLNKFYSWLYRKSCKPEDRGAYSAGFWQDRIRTEAVNLCADCRGKLLEVGCGEGIFLKRLASLNNRVEIWGIDNNQARLDQFKLAIETNNLRNMHALLQDAQKIDFENEIFDTVIGINVIFNLPDKNITMQVLREMGRVCKKNGRLIFDFRNSANFLLKLKYFLAPHYDATVKDLPLVTYRMDEFMPLLKEMGFEVIRKIPIGFPKGKFSPVVIIEAKKL